MKKSFIAVLTAVSMIFSPMTDVFAENNIVIAEIDEIAEETEESVEEIEEFIEKTEESVGETDNVYGFNDKVKTDMEIESYAEISLAADSEYKDTVIYGDIDNDGDIDEDDLSMLEKIIVGTMTADARTLLAGDLNFDGEISLVDATKLRIYLDSSTPLEFIASGYCGDNVTWKLGSDGTLTISGAGEMTNWGSISAVPWHSNRGKIKSVVINNGVTNIGNESFWGCDSLTSVTIPSSVTNIERGAFESCKELTNVTISNGVTSIGAHSFWGCDSLTSITIPSSVTSIGNSAFRNCNKLTAINVNSGNTNYKSINGVLFNKDGTELIQYLKGKTEKSYTIPDNVTSIGSYAFSDCDNLISIEIPNSVTIIRNDAFENCHALTSVTIPNSVTIIGADAFKDCYALTSVIISDGVTIIGDYAFFNCSKLSEVTVLSSSVKYGTSYVFGNIFSNLVLKGYAGSTTETYAKDNNITFEEIAMYSISGNFKTLDEEAFSSVSAIQFKDMDNNCIYDGTITGDKFNANLPNGNYEIITTAAGYKSASHIAVNGASPAAKTVYFELIEKPKTAYTKDVYVDISKPTSSTNYNTLKEAIDAVNNMYPQPESEDERITIHIAPGTYRAQSILTTPYVTLENTDPNNEVKLTWYYGVGCKYYSCGEDGYYNELSARDKFLKNGVRNWGTSFQVESSAHDFYAENITFENSFNKYLTEEEISDGVEKDDINNYNYDRTAANADVLCKAAHERAAAITSRADNSEFYKCKFLSNQCTLYTYDHTNQYFRNCYVEGMVDAILGGGNVIFDGCELCLCGYSDSALGGYFIAPRNGDDNNGFTFNECNITEKPDMKVGTGYFGRMWGENSTVRLINTTVEKSGLISNAGWADMINTLKTCSIYEYNNKLADGTALKSTAATKQLTDDEIIAIDTGKADYFNGWIPKNYADFKVKTAAKLDNKDDIVASGTCGDNLTWTLGSKGTLTISGTGKMTDWSSSDNIPWYSYISDIKSVVINDGVTSIGDRAFYNCGSLTSIEIPASVMSIDNGAFIFCDRLTSINVDSQNRYYKSIDDVLFSKDGTQLVKYPARKTSTSYIIPTNVTSIGYQAFYSCKNLTSIEIPTSVTSIGNGAFEYCRNLTSIEIPTSVTFIGDNAFLSCISLTSIEIPASVASISGHAFEFCNKLTNINVDSENQYYKSIDGVLFSKDETTLVKYPENKADISYTIPISVTSIGPYSIVNCMNLTSIEIPENITAICDGVLVFCSKLKNVTVLSPTVSFEGSSIFTGCNSLVLKCYKGSTTEAYAIENGYNYEYISISISAPTLNVTENNGVKTLEMTCADGAEIYYTIDGSDPTEASEHYTQAIVFDYAINCTVKAVAIQSGGGRSEIVSQDIKVVKTPAPTASIVSGTVKYGTEVTLSGNGTIYYSINGGEYKVYEKAIVLTASSVIRVYAKVNGQIDSDKTEYEYTVEKKTQGTVGSISWSYANGTLTLTGAGVIPDFESGEAPWYSLAEDTTSVKIERGITAVGTYAFYAMNKIKSVSMPGVNQINKSAFEGCAGLETMDLPETMTGGIGENAFKDCYFLTSFKIPNNVSSIGKGAFEGCSSLTSITVPFIGLQQNNTTDTFACIFNDDVPSTLKSITVTNETYIPDNAFAGLSDVESITVNKSINSIGSGAFDGCRSLKSFTVPEGISTLSDYTFRNCEKAVVITVPDTVTSFGEGVFDGCKKLSEINIPNGVETICSHTFRNCSSLIRIKIPTSVKFIEDGILEGCTSLMDIKVPFIGARLEDNNIFGYLFGVADNSEIPVSVTKVEITSTERSSCIPQNAFKDCGNIEDIIIDGGRSIDAGAFENCKMLKHLYIPSSIAAISYGTPILKGCTRVSSITIPFVGTNRRDQNTETAVVGALFGYDDTDISGGTMQYYNESRSYHYYKVPKSLKTINLLNQTNIPTGAFMNCDFLENVTVVTGAVMNNHAFYYCPSLKNVVLPNDLTTIGEEVFAECESLEKINIPTKVKTIGANAFYNCRALVNVSMPDSIEAIADDIFNGTNLYGESVQLMAKEGTITCSYGSKAYEYAIEKGIAVNIAEPNAFDIKKTSTTVNLLSDDSYLFDIINLYNMRGVLHIELYNKNDNLISEKTVDAAGEVEYRIELSEEEMKGVSFVKIYVATAEGNTVSTEDEIISYESGDIPVIPESDLTIAYSNGIITLGGTTRIKPGTILIQAIYDDRNKLVKTVIYDVKTNGRTIKVEDFNDKTSKFMLWDNITKMKPLAKSITVN